MKSKFLKDLELVYKIVLEKDEDLNSFFEIVENRIENSKKEFVDSCIKKFGLELNDENRLAFINKLVNLRFDTLNQRLKNANFSEHEIEDIKYSSFDIASSYHIKMFEEMLLKIEEKSLLSPFYRELLKGFHEIGKSFTKLEYSWNKIIIDGSNKKLEERFDNKSEILNFLKENHLFDVEDGCDLPERSYSALSFKNEKFQSLSYSEAFVHEVHEILVNITQLIDNLRNLNDDVFFQKEQILNYLNNLHEAFCETNRYKLLEKWSRVDLSWMDITTPIQPTHPFEYYEDIYRHSVACEFDVRIIDPKRDNSWIKDSLKKMFETFCKDFECENSSIHEATIKNLENTQSYIGLPLFYYGAMFNGLFSAQVIPNDENVSKLKGKKIFGYADRILQTQRAKPFLKIQKIIYGGEFLQKERELIFKLPDIWHKIYEIITIGHEYGHILWMDESSEIKMNVHGEFKNIEEFKATTGGLVAYFETDSDELWEYILIDTIKRSIGLISWMKEIDVRPYYIESLIHLDLLFQANILSFQENELRIRMNREYYNNLKIIYVKTYKELVQNYYLIKQSPKNFIEKYVHEELNTYYPNKIDLKNFVKYYWNLYQNIGQIVDESDLKSNWKRN